MTSKTFKQRDIDSYAGLVDAFDDLTQQFTVRAASRLIRGVDLRDKVVVDVGCGTGVVALEAARHVGAGRVIGFDLSPEMLEFARQQCAAAGEDRVTFRQGDAENLGIEDASVDVVFSLYALLHFPNPDKATREMWRMLKPGGRVAIGIGSGPPLLSRQAPGYVLRSLPWMIGERRGNVLVAPAMLDELTSRLARPDQEETHLAQQRSKGHAAQFLLDLLKTQGFTELSTAVEHNVDTIDDPETFWKLQATLSSKSRKRILSLSREERADLLARFMDRCESVLARGGKLVYPNSAFIVRATRSG